MLSKGFITLIVGMLATVLMPSSPTSTASYWRGANGWFTPREEKIMVNRIIREDPSKSSMHNREAMTPKLLWQSMKDFDLWPIYILGLMFQTPMSTPAAYLTLSLREMGFDTFKTNLLVIPKGLLHVVAMLGLTYAAEVFKELTFISLIGQLWALPFIIFLNVVDINSINKWTAWAFMTVFLSYPSGKICINFLLLWPCIPTSPGSGITVLTLLSLHPSYFHTTLTPPSAHPIQVGWTSRNSNTVRSRTVSAALYNMSVQTSGIIASNIYRTDDAPLYHRGNHVLLVLIITNIILYLATKVYYIQRNKYRDRIWGAMSEDERLEYITTTTDEGSKRLDFRFVH
jgi:hypothetical protein